MQGEIQAVLREFEVRLFKVMCVCFPNLLCFQHKRQNVEVYDLLSTLENLSEIRDIDLNRAAKLGKQLPEINVQLLDALKLAENIIIVNNALLHCCSYFTPFVVAEESERTINHEHRTDRQS